MRRIFYKSGLFILFLFFTGILCAQDNLTKYVNPFIGTGGHGHTFPGATTPFGMVQLSPDTRIDGSWDGCSGYHYNDSIIYGFSHTHLSGTGCSDYGDIMLMPQIGIASFEKERYAASFSHKNEMAAPGYYSVIFNNGIKTELTATTRTGIHRYHFPEKEGHIILDLNHRDLLTQGNIKVINNTTVAVMRISRAWAKEQHIYAYIQFSKPFDYTYNENKTKIIFHFSLSSAEPLLTRVGISLVSTEGAKSNLQTEMPGWNFDATVEQAAAVWNKELSKIIISDTHQEKLINFYTALYHTMIHPNIATDVNGDYRGMDNRIHKATGFNYYTVFSLWDTFRACHPLYTLIAPDRNLDFIRTFIRQYAEGGRLPVWELASNETDCMIGYHSVSVIADAYVKGIRDFDTEMAFEAMKKSANWNHLGLPQYMKQGFISVDDEHESVSKTLEYAYDDWCIAQMAKYLKKNDDYITYMERSNAWRNLLNPETKLMRPRKNGGWLSPFEPREVNNHFTEGNSWQYSFFVPQDINGLIKATGGMYAFETQLDALFNASTQTTGREQADITGLIGQYAHGNEPSHHIAYLYNYINRPEKTKQRVHQILNDFYKNEPDGLIGNEDCGQMSAWYVLSALGLYAVTPGLPQYTITQPFLDGFQVSTEQGVRFTDITIKTAMEKGNFITHAALKGSKENDFTIAETTEAEYITAPVISAASVAFKDSMQVYISSGESDSICHVIRYAENNKPVFGWEKTFSIHDNAVIEAFSVRNRNGLSVRSKPSSAVFFKNPHPNWTIELKSTYNPQYHAGGPSGIIDGIRGTVNWRKGEWQGYQGQDFEAIVKLDSVKKIKYFSGRFLQDTSPWILMPKKVEYYISLNGADFTKIGEVANTVATEDYTAQIKDFAYTMKKAKPALYIKVKAINYGKLPSWHAGAGYDAFIFVDELNFN